MFDKIHIDIQKPQFTLAPCSEMPPKYPEPHQITEILIINFDERYMFLHRIKDKLVLNATAVSDFKKALWQKHNIQQSENSVQPQK